MNKFLMTGLTIMMTVIANAQSIEEQATKAGNDAYANAMIRNVLIIVGVAVVYFLFKSSSKKTDKKD
jgi:heme/copper-type cytochrome/quinol oxidase subunit 2